eukprot:scaffold140574_cov48-Attheya_sp.AAC.1
MIGVESTLLRRETLQGKRNNGYSYDLIKMIVYEQDCSGIRAVSHVLMPPNLFNFARMMSLSLSWPCDVFDMGGIYLGRHNLCNNPTFYLRCDNIIETNGVKSSLLRRETLQGKRNNGYSYGLIKMFVYEQDCSGIRANNDP